MDIKRQYNTLYSEKVDLENQIEILSSKYLEADSLLEDKDRKLNELEEIRKSKEKEVQKLNKILETGNRNRGKVNEVDRVESKKRESFLKRIEDICSNLDTRKLKGDLEVLNLLLRQSVKQGGASTKHLEQPEKVVIERKSFEICEKM
jgi:hypothetical protein